LEEARKSFYTEFFNELGGILVVIAYVYKKEKTIAQSVLTTIAIASLAQLLTYQLYTLQWFPFPFGKQILKFSIYTYILIEAICCLTYLKINIRSNGIKKMIWLCRLLFSAYIILTAGLLNTGIFQFHTEITEAFLIIGFCLYFFYESLQKTDKLSFFQPCSWAILGMLTLFGSTLPLFVFLGYFKSNASNFKYSLFAINHVAYFLLFIAFTIAIVYDKTAKQSQ